MSILVTFCNRVDYDHPCRDLYLVELEPESGEVRKIDLPAEVREQTTGMTGICHHPKGYVAVLPPSTLVYLRPDFRVWDVKRLPQMSEGHSVSVHDGVSYVVSTGNDKVLRVPDTGDVQVFWQGTYSGCDTIHLNGILWRNSECLVSGFGEKDNSGWRSARAGFVYNVTTGSYPMRAVCYPHSLLTGEDGELWICESGRQSITAERGLRAEFPWTFTRGLCRARGLTFFVGSSHIRVKSHSTGLPTGVTQTGTCGVGTVTITRRGPQIGRFYDLSPFTDEIYDLLDTEARPAE